MAGYRAPGNKFTNATTKNNQMDDQRAKYQEKNEARTVSEKLGIARSDLASLFRFDVGGLDNIFEASISTFEDLDSRVGEGNPDFNNGTSLRSIGAGRTAEGTMFSDVTEQADKPNKKGPNLIAPNINDATFANNDQQTSQFTERGFGWSDKRNNAGEESARIGKFFSKHYSALGASEDSPVFGEAKSPDPDTNIDYNQP